jgi:hypothetical protein
MTRPRTWMTGFTVEVCRADGYEVRRVADDRLLPTTFVPERVRLESSASTALVAHAVLGRAGTICSALSGLREEWARLSDVDRLSLVGIAERQAVHVYEVLGDVLRGAPGRALEHALAETPGLAPLRLVTDDLS